MDGIAQRFIQLSMHAYNASSFNTLGASVIRATRSMQAITTLAQRRCAYLLIILILRIIASIFLLSRFGLLSPNTTRTSTTKGRAEGEINVLLGVETDNEGRNVNYLLANTDVSLADENTGVVNGLGETELVDTGLQTTLQEILNLQGQHVIELHAGLIQDTNSHETANEGVTFEESLGILLVEGEQLTEASQ
jgi:hypothetical protein